VRRKLGPGEKDNFGIVTPDAITGLRDRLFGTIFIVAIAVPGIALVVGAIVIMNIMLVSVTERTREIGIRMAVGAKARQILTQFLLEAVVLSTIGGILGVIFGVVSAELISALAGWAILLPPEAIVLAVLFSGAVGIFFGFYPARKAARLDPIQALRYE
jgi:putative ABC transport system permease protein